MVVVRVVPVVVRVVPVVVRVVPVGAVQVVKVRSGGEEVEIQEVEVGNQDRSSHLL